jgi:alpha-beta hydrolase superfamily lysophospholipase
MKHAPPQPPELGRLAGLSYALFMPDREPRAGVVILHGAGSAKESHFDFARLCREAGLAALAYDARGHGRSDGPVGASAVEDALAMCHLMREHAPQVALRGSSMGGCFAIHAAAGDPGIAAVVAICPAPERLLLRALRSEEHPGLRVDRPLLEPFLESLDLYESAARLGPETALLILHARGDEQVPYTVSEELHSAAHEPKRLILFPGGHHRSLQHDLEVQNLSLRFMKDAAEKRGG